MSITYLLRMMIAVEERMLPRIQPRVEKSIDEKMIGNGRNDDRSDRGRRLNKYQDPIY
jgi:hypothetical protein